MGRRAHKFVMREWRELGDLGRLADAIASTRHTQNLQPLVMDRPMGKRILVVAPHADDEIIGPGGTLIKSLNDGASVHVVYLTDDDTPPGKVRHAEALEVAQKVGYTTEFLQYPSDDLPVSSEAAAILATCINLAKPTTVFIPFISDDHQDHRKASQLLWKAEADGALKCAPEVWAYQVYSAVIPNIVVDITDVIQEKSAAISGWKNSAMKSRDWAHFSAGLNAYNSRFLANGSGRFAEAFFVVPIAEYLDLCGAYFSE